ncbi:signal peptidase I [Candidatus Saccharibacteria bacterium]|nr:signal peptidase I [Candidatus Saccharibacteria bacterium]
MMQNQEGAESDTPRAIVADGSSETPKSSKIEEPSTIRSVLSTIGILLLAPLIAVVLTLYVFQSYQVDGPSMESTLQNNDRLIVWKLPRTWARITGNQYVPKRGDIIILNESGLSSFGSTEDTKQLVKRVIGLPGDKIVIENNVLTVYNSDFPNGFQPDTTLPYGKNGAIPPTSNKLSIELKDNELFVCGDNRPQSLDSRTFGPITTDQVVGKLVARILPLNNVEKF